MEQGILGALLVVPEVDHVFIRVFFMKHPSKHAHSGASLIIDPKL